MKRPKTIRLTYRKTWYQKQLDIEAEKIEKDIDKMFEDALLFHLSRTPSQRRQDSEEWKRQVVPVGKSAIDQMIPVQRQIDDTWLKMQELLGVPNDHENSCRKIHRRF